MEQRPPLQTRVAAALHPSNRGRGNGYTQEMRDLAMHVRQTGQSRNPLIMQLRELHLYPSIMTERQWQNILTRLGGITVRVEELETTVLLSFRIMIKSFLYCTVLPTQNAQLLKSMPFSTVLTMGASHFVSTPHPKYLSVKIGLA